MRNVFERIGIENDEIREIAVVDLANVRAGLAAEKFGRIRCRALENLHRRESCFFH